MLETYSLIGWIVIGGIAGIFARIIMPGRNPNGCVVTIILGISGALLAGFIGNKLGWYKHGQAGGFIAATLGAMAILYVHRIVFRKR